MITDFKEFIQSLNEQIVLKDVDWEEPEDNAEITI